MAFAYVQGNDNQSFSANTLSVTITGVTLGNIVVAFMYSRDTPTVTGTPSWGAHIVGAGAWAHSECHWADDGSGSVTATYTLAANKRIYVAIAEWSYDTAKTLVLETDVHGGGNPMDDTGDLITTTNDPALLISWVGYWGGATMADANGATRHRYTNHSNFSFAFGSRTVSPTGNYGSDWQQSGSTGLQFAFSEQAAGGGGINLNQIERKVGRGIGRGLYRGIA